MRGCHASIFTLKNILNLCYMRNKLDIITCAIRQRIVLALLMVVGFVAGVSAQENTVRIESFSLKPNASRVVPVILENSQPISSLQMDITLPSGVSYVEGSLKRNDERLDRDEHSLMITKVTGTVSTYRLVILTTYGNNIIGNDGEVAYITLKAANDFSEAGQIIIDNIVGSDRQATKIEIPSRHDAVVSPDVARLSFGVRELKVKTDGAASSVDVMIQSDVDVYGLQADIALPQGLAFVTNASGRLAVTGGDVLSANATIRTNLLADGTARVVVSSLIPEKFASAEGKVLSFSVTAAEGLADTTAMTISAAGVSHITSSGKTVYYAINDTTGTVINSTSVAYTPAQGVIASLSDSLASAEVRIDTVAPDVKDSACIVAIGDSLAGVIENMRSAVESAYADGSLVDVVDGLLAPADGVLAAIGKYVDDAIAAQLAYEKNAAAAAANEEAYARLTLTIANLRDSLAAATDTIAVACADVAAGFADRLAAIGTRIEAVSDSVDAEYAAVRLTSESIVDSISISQAISGVVADAKSAQAEYEANEAKVAANEEAYARLRSEIAGLRTSLSAATDTIAEKCPDVSARFTVSLYSIQQRIDAVADSVDIEYAAVRLTSESVIGSESIQAAIDELVRQAKKAQEEFDITNGVSGVDADAGRVEFKVYNLGGTELPAPKKGAVNVFRYSDGTVKKVYVR